MHDFEIKPHLQTILRKLSKKDKVAYEAVMRKIGEITESPDVEHYKNLRHNMKDRKRVHVMGSFVLVFGYDRQRDFISFMDYDHHDNIYL
jgi:YafQ family addiction module toxin component